MDHGVPAVVTLPAEIDFTNAKEVSDQICAVIGPGVTAVIADLTATIFCDSSGLRHLLLAHKRASAAGAQLRFAIPSASPVRRILQLTGTDDVLAVYQSLDEAITDRSPPGRPEGREHAAGDPPAHPTAT